LEPASDFETGSRDPVAELFGFSPSMPVEPESRESMRPDGEMSDDEFGERRERYATDEREESDFRGEAPTRSPEDRSDRTRPRRRRGGRGRGRDRGDDRGGYDRQPRPASIERSDDDRPMSIVRALKGTSITISNRRHVARSRKNRCASAPNANLAVKIGSRSADAAAAVAEVVHATATKSGASRRLDRQAMSSRHRPMPA